MRNGKARKATPIEFEEGSGNVFADLELPNADELLAKAKLVSQLDDAIRARRLTQKKAADILGVPRSDLAQLLRGDLERFSTGALFRFLGALNLEVDIIVRPKTKDG